MTTDDLSRKLFGLSMLMLMFGIGVVAEHYDVFPLPWLKSSVLALDNILNRTGARLPWYYRRTDVTSPVRVLLENRMAPGLTLVAGAGGDRDSRIRVVDATGRVLHEWKPDWWSIWPHPDYLPKDVLPKSAPALVEGVLLMPNGDIVFNFMAALALVRMDYCGNVVWKRPWQTHHVVSLGNRGNLWVPALHIRRQEMKNLPNYEPPIRDYTLLQVSPDGRLLREIPVFDILKRNGLDGLLYVSALNDRSTTVRGNTMHLNDIDVFPDSMKPGVFAPGDVMMSLRNLDAVFVFDPRDLRIKFSLIGRTLRQHDPDFVDGNTISVFDNNNLLGDEDLLGEPSSVDSGQSSRILRFSAISHDVDTLYAGTPQHPFFTDVMGQHQRLSNGDMLLTESVPGRVLEVDQDGRTVWEYYNLVRPGVRGTVSDAYRLPRQFDERFFTQKAAECGSGN